MQDGKKHPVISREILAVRFPQTTIKSTTTQKLAQYISSDPMPFPDGPLVGVKGQSDVFAIDRGMRRPIADAVTFQTYGWDWNQIHWTNERSVLLEPLGDPISTKLEPEDVIQSASIK